MMVTSKKLLEKYHRWSKFVKNLIFFLKILSKKYLLENFFYCTLTQE